MSDNGKLYNVKVIVRNRRTTVALTDYNIKASIYCYKDDEYDYVQGRTLAFKKALAKKYKLEYENAINDVENDKVNFTDEECKILADNISKQYNKNIKSTND